MQATRAKGILVGGLMFVTGLGYLYLTATLPRRGVGDASFVDASFIPYILALLMLGLGALQLIAAFRTIAATGGDLRDVEAEADVGMSDYRTVVATLGLVAAYVALLRPLGFPIATALYLFVQFIVLTPTERGPSYGLYAMLAVICSTVIFVMFRYGFQLLLPAGPLTSLLP